MIKNRAKAILQILNSLLLQPRQSLGVLWGLPFTAQGFEYGKRWRACSGEQSLSSVSSMETQCNSSNPLRAYFDSYVEGRGIWKWLHYFDIYHRHFSKFIGREVRVLEIGVYSGGSLKMWRQYFGQHCLVYGVDIEEACRVYEDDRTKVFVGDQSDRSFWKVVKTQVPMVDIVIDDGGHQAKQQIVTLEEMLPHIRPGGLYLCEDVHGDGNQFNSYINGLAAHLNAFGMGSNDKTNRIAYSPTPFQNEIHSIHLYPFVTVIEKTDSHVDQFVAPKHGTEWQPFL